MERKSAQQSAGVIRRDDIRGRGSPRDLMTRRTSYTKPCASRLWARFARLEREDLVHSRSSIERGVSNMQKRTYGEIAGGLDRQGGAKCGADVLCLCIYFVYCMENKRTSRASKSRARPAAY